MKAEFQNNEKTNMKMSQLPAGVYIWGGERRYSLELLANFVDISWIFILLIVHMVYILL